MLQNTKDNIECNSYLNSFTKLSLLGVMLRLGNRSELVDTIIPKGSGWVKSPHIVPAFRVLEIVPRSFQWRKSSAYVEKIGVGCKLVNEIDPRTFFDLACRHLSHF